MGPLKGIKVVEFAGIGPAPFCAMLLADLGADVVRLDRPARAQLFQQDPKSDLLNRNKRSVAIDLKNARGLETALRLCAGAEVIIEGFRPGVMERLGLGPDVLHARNPRLVYARMTGFGQTGPLAQAAGHDLNYIALSGMLHGIGESDRPPAVPLNLVGDFGGGGMMLAFGIAAALLEARASGKGQVIDAAMTEGAALLGTMVYGLFGAGLWNDARASNFLDGAAHFYSTYETADGKAVAVGPIEPQFYAQFLARMGLDAEAFSAQLDPAGWPELKARLAAKFKEQPRAHWDALLSGTDCCYAPVLSLAEAPEHPHARARQSFLQPGGVPQPAPAPRFSRTPAELRAPPPLPGADTEAALLDWGFAREEIDALLAVRAVEAGAD